MAKIDIPKILGDLAGTIFKFFDDAYNQGWLLYLLVILLVLFVVLLFQRSTYIATPLPLNATIIT